MAEKAPHPRVAEFISECAAAGIDCEDVVKRAGIHRASWHRWRTGAFAPSMRNLDAVHAALAALTRDKAA